MSQSWFKHIRKSRKGHYCSICKKTIEKGSEYFDDISIRDSKFDTRKYHCECWSAYSDWIDSEAEKSIIIESGIRKCVENDFNWERDFFDYEEDDEIGKET